MTDRISRRPRDAVTSPYRVRYEDELNAEQLAAVMHPGGPMLTLAGAGTGKTRTLVYRCSRLIEDGVAPDRILLVTFTNKAAREMLDRVAQLVEHGGARVTGGTFHSVGHRILRRYGESLGYSTRFSIIDREDATELMGSALAELSPELPARRSPKPKLLLELYSYIVNTGSDLESAVLSRAPQYLDQAELMAGVFRHYLQRKQQADVMDFDDLLLNWLLILKRFPTIRGELAARFDHLLVDEYQDTNRLQADIVDGMLNAKRNVMVVGDDAQSIYAFRGADFENILGFPERHQGCTVFRLTTNYRSSPEILALANASIRNNERQFEKELVACRAAGDMPLEVAVPNPELQAEWVAERILALREEGIELEDMAVLYRNHAHSLDLQVALTRRNIPYRVRSGLRFFEHRHVKDVLAHLRFADNPRDEIAFARAIKLRRGFGPRLAARLWSAIAGGEPMARLMALDPRSVELPRQARQSMEPARTLLHDLQRPELSAHPGEAIRHVVEEFYRQWARDNLDNASSRLDDLEQLALFADPYPDLNAFLAEITLLNDLSGEDAVAGLPDEMLTLSTTHQAKGLEWRAVFVIWLAEGRFPSIRAEDEEEERRLFYVACTRARDHLFLVYPEIARDRYRVDLILDPSRFVLELPESVRERLAVPPPTVVEELPALDGAGRYQLPDFLGPADDDVN